MMVVFFVLVWISTWFSIVFWIIQFIKLKENERIKVELERIDSLKGLDKFKYKIKNVFKKQEKPEIKPVKFTEKQIKKYIIASVIVFVVSFIGIGITAPQAEISSSDNTSISEKISDIEEEIELDYKNEIEFEKELNSGNTEMKGKIVKFKVLEYKPNSIMGVNCWAGEHLNFISKNEINAKKDDIIIAKITENPTSSLGSWYIHYEKLADANEIEYDTDKTQDEEFEEQEKIEENNIQIKGSNNASNLEQEKQETPEKLITESQKTDIEQNVSSNSNKNEPASTSASSNSKANTSSQSTSSSVSTNTDTSSSYILNTNTKKFHYSSCSSVKKMKDSNKQLYNGSRNDVIARGYEPCQICHP